MKLSIENKRALCQEFAAVKDLDEFVALLNKVKSIGEAQFSATGEENLPDRISIDYEVPNNSANTQENPDSLITRRELLGYALPDAKRKTPRYVTFEIPKKSGKPRTIHAPVLKLKRIQMCINVLLQAVFQPHAAANGFVPGKSIINNALLHTGREFVFNIDLQDFFPSIEQARIWKRLQFPPFNLTSGTPRRQIADVVAGICCFTLPQDAKQQDGDEAKNSGIESPRGEARNVLPQGAPTSPTITNIICERLDRKLTGLAKKHKLRYSRYADDITFSSNHYVYSANGEFRIELRRIIQEQGFRINEAKTRLQKPGYRQEVTGLTVNEKPNVPQRYIKQLRRWIHLWETRGYETAQAIFIKEYVNPEKGRGYAKLAQEGAQLSNVLDGKLMFLKMVKGERNPTFLKLRERFIQLRETKMRVQRSQFLLVELIRPVKALLKKEELTEEEIELASTALSLFDSLKKDKSSLELHDEALRIIDRMKKLVPEEETMEAKTDLTVGIKKTPEPSIHTPGPESSTGTTAAVEGPSLKEVNLELFHVLDKLAHEGIDDAMKAFAKK